MSTTMEELYQQRLRRYVTAMRKGKPDQIPIRPFVAEFVATYAGYTCQQVAQDYELAFTATRKCCKDFDWDAAVPNMVYGWMGLAQAIGLKYYAVPGVHIPATTGFQYMEPSEDEAYMQPEEYDVFTKDPTAFLFNTWLPRVSSEQVPLGQPNTVRNNLSYLKGGMAMLSYFNSFGRQIDLMRRESGTVSAISGILKAPFDILADKFRGYVGLCMDLAERPEKVKAACEALMPHMFQVALSGADPNKNVPIGFWMHRGCVPFISHEQFENLYWPTLKPIIEELWRRGHQVLFYAEGKWAPHLKFFAELPEGSIVYHCDRDDVIETHKAIGHKFCLSGGIPNEVMAYGTPDDIRARCKRIIDGAAREGGYIMDSSAIMQNDAKPENVRAMTEFTREYGGYSGPSSPGFDIAASQAKVQPVQFPPSEVKPGVCLPWDQQITRWPKITGDADLIHRVWDDVESLAYTYAWQCVESF